MRTIQGELQKEIKRIAKENNVSEEKVIEIYSTVWEFVRNKIKSGDRDTGIFPVVQLRFLGTFFVAPGRVKRIKEKIKNSKK